MKEREREMYANQATFLKDGESQVSNSWVRGQCVSRRTRMPYRLIGLVNEETNKQRLASVRKRGGRDGDDEGKNWNYEGGREGKKEGVERKE